MKESAFQSQLKKELKVRYPGCTVKKMDPKGLQGFPDLLILFGKLWALLEVKKDGVANKQPNQEYYVNQFSKQGFSSFIYPENKEDVLHALDQYFQENQTNEMPS